MHVSIVRGASSLLLATGSAAIMLWPGQPADADHNPVPARAQWVCSTYVDDNGDPTYDGNALCNFRFTVNNYVDSGFKYVRYCMNFTNTYTEEDGKKCWTSFAYPGEERDMRREKDLWTGGGIVLGWLNGKVRYKGGVYDQMVGKIHRSASKQFFVADQDPNTGPFFSSGLINTDMYSHCPILDPCEADPARKSISVSPISSLPTYWVEDGFDFKAECVGGSNPTLIKQELSNKHWRFQVRWGLIGSYTYGPWRDVRIPADEPGNKLGNPTPVSACQINFSLLPVS